ncbi:MAG TPA: class I SAM-dependent methyltransferase [Candidatus Acidoferrales bacterium]|nr:class I SAM-dependent methyltransferase [Candidatus Acidoferrales bacterium]
MPAREHALTQNYFGSYWLTKFRYSKRMLRHRLRGQPRVCPYCGPGSEIKRLRRKKLLVDILQCEGCKLIFRWPADTPEELDRHYDNEYAEAAPQVRLPGAEELKRLLEEEFRPLFADVSHKVKVLKSLRDGGKALDFGCSWGYATSLLRKYGFDATGFEVSNRRANYARERLGLTVVNSPEELEGMPSRSFDVIYSNHVLEHVPSIRNALSLFSRLLKDDGIGFHILPNFTGKTARSGAWLAWIGEDHPIAPTAEFFKHALPEASFRKFQFLSSPFSESLGADLAAGKTSDLEGDELLVLTGAA